MISPISSPWPKPIRGTRKNWLSMAILNSDLLHGRAVLSSLGPGPSLCRKFENSVERAKIGQAWPFYTATCFMILCIMSQNFRPIAEFLKVLKQQRLSSDLVLAFAGNFKVLWNMQQDRRWNADKPSAALDPYIPIWLTTSPANQRPANFWKSFFSSIERKLWKVLHFQVELVRTNFKF